MKKTLLPALFAALFSLSAMAQTDGYTNGILILNEGGFGVANASVSFLPNEGELQNDIYTTANDGAALGEIAQNMVFHDNNAYIVLNVTGAVKIVNAQTFELIATIEGLVNPRYIAFSGAAAYVTCWGDPTVATDDYVAVIDTTTNTITSTIPVNEGPETIVERNGKLYVAQKGGYNFGNTIAVIDAATNTLTSTLNVGYSPNSLSFQGGYLYVLCGGVPSYVDTEATGLSETTGRLFKFDTNNENFMETNMIFPGMQHPKSLFLGGNDIFYTKDEDMAGSLYHTTTSEPLLPTEPFITLPAGAEGESFGFNIYGFNVIDDVIYIADAGDYTTAGKVSLYTITGEAVNSYSVGVAPSSFYKAPEPPLGLPENIAGLSLTVYPNPATEVIFLNTQKEANVQVYDLMGRVVVKNQKYTANGINVSVLPTGTYLAEITIDNAKSVKKIVVR